MARDSLRATLDELKVDPTSAQDRPYLEAMLRRLGYTEKEIREELGPVVEADPAPAPAPSDPLAPTREYRLVVPARESSFAFDNEFRGSRTDAPFEDFEHVEFQEAAPQEETVEFEEVDAASVQEPQELEFVDESAAAQADAGETDADRLAEFEPTEAQELLADAPAEGVEDVSIDTFGGPDVDAKPKTRVRVKRVRAKSKAEAEAKVATGSRRVIKSIPVDIVERWGAQPDDDAQAKRRKGGAP